MDSHGAFLRSQLEEQETDTYEGDALVEALARADLDAASAAGLPPPVRALLEVAGVLTREPSRITDEHVQGLREHGWTEPQIAEMVYVTAMFAFFNRVAEAFGIDSEGYGGPRIER